MKLSEIYIRDPFILPYENKYYLFGSEGELSKTGQTVFNCYISKDLEEWSNPIRCFEAPDGFWGKYDFWAPEVHFYNGRFYMFATFNADEFNRTVQILASDKPEGPYEVFSEPITPKDWMSLDGTLYVEDGVPYMIFCHEWAQITDGEMCLQELSPDLKKAVGEPKLLFKASDSPYTSDKLHGGFITDGPFIYKTNYGKLIMIWSSFDEKGYIEAVAFSENGKITGEWKHSKPLSDKNGGHGMIFKAFDNKLYFIMHHPNSPQGKERPKLTELKEISEEPFFKAGINNDN